MSIGWMFEWKKNIIEGYCNVCGGENHKADSPLGIFQTNKDPYGDVWICAKCLGQAIKKVDKDYRLPLSPNYGISFDFKRSKWVGITIEMLHDWEKLFPDVDLANVIGHDMLFWLVKWKDSPKSRKRNYTRFILNWLKREQQKAVGL